MKFANAPVSYGVFGDLSVDGATTTDDLLKAMSEAGYEGSELGPPRFFGAPQQAKEAFTNAGLLAAGVYIPLHTQDRGAVLERDLDRMAMSLDEVEAVNPGAPIILADEGDEVLLRNPRKPDDLMLDADGWARLYEVINDASARVQDRGLAVSFHPHIATYIERPDEIERLLENTDVSLTFDVGHVVLAGGDGTALFKQWRDRINHVHIKDVRRSVLEDARREGRADFDTWWADVCTPLGEGDAELESFTQALLDTHYDGWVVVEQDRAPLVPDVVAEVFRDQAENVRWLAERLR